MSEIKELEVMLSYYGRQIQKAENKAKIVIEQSTAKYQEAVEKLKVKDPKVIKAKQDEISLKVQEEIKPIQEQIKPLKLRYDLIESKIGKIAEGKLNEFVKA